MTRWSIEVKNHDHGNPRYDQGHGPTTVLAIVEAKSRRKARAKYAVIQGYPCGGCIIRKIQESEKT